MVWVMLGFQDMPCTAYRLYFQLLLYKYSYCMDVGGVFQIWIMCHGSRFWNLYPRCYLWGSSYACTRVCISFLPSLIFFIKS